MCMEDVQIGRETLSADVTLVVSTSSTLLASASPNRYCLIISPPIAGRVTIGMDSNHVVDAVGLVLAAGCDPLVLTVQEHGELCRKAWYGAVDAGTRNVGIAWSILERN